MSRRTVGAVTNPLDDPMRRVFGQVCGWVTFNGVTTTTILDSENVSSITDGGTGTTTVTWATPMQSANYAVGVGLSPVSGTIGMIRAGTTAPTAAAVIVVGSGPDGGAATDQPVNCVAAIDETINPSPYRQRRALRAETWVSYDTSTSTVNNASRNVASLTDNATGDTTVTFVSGYANINYCFIVGLWHSANEFGVGLAMTHKSDVARTEGACRLFTSLANPISARDVDFAAVAIFGH